MFTELNNILELSAEQFPGGRNIVILEKQDTDASFILHHFICYCLKTGRKLCLVTTYQTFTHYNNVANKLGVNLAAERERGNVLVLDLMTDLKQQILQQHADDSRRSDINQSEQFLKAVYTRIDSCVKKLTETSDTLILLDELSVLTSIGLNADVTRHFMQYLRALVTEQSKACVVVLHACDAAGEDEERDLQAKYLCHGADMVITVAGLTSGFCKDVHGQMTVKWKNMEECQRKDTKTMQFKITDKNVKFFPSGMSSAVL